MKHVLIALLAIILCVPAVSAPQDDPAAPVRQFIDAFNGGDTKTALAIFASGPITIIDEFAPNLWTGPGAAQQWFADYDKHAEATGVTDGKVTYGKATRVETSGDVAYVILPTVYLYKEHGKPIREEGQITVVLNRENGAWKIRSWTWTGVKPHPVK